VNTDGHSFADTREDDWHGWNVVGTAVHVGPLPGRKSICLYVIEGTTLRTLAFFKSPDDAATALRMMDLLAMTDRRVVLMPLDNDGEVPKEDV
jgi:hypothetical protein